MNWEYCFTGSALFAERKGRELFTRGEYPEHGDVPEPVGTGVLDGKLFSSFSDADPRIGARWNCLPRAITCGFPSSISFHSHPTAGSCCGVSCGLRQRFDTTPSFKETELGEVLLPVLCPVSWQHPDDAVRLGAERPFGKNVQGYDHQVPFGQKDMVGRWRGSPFARAARTGVQPGPRRACGGRAMPLPDDLLNPIDGPNPSGVNLKYDPIYEKVPRKPDAEETQPPPGMTERNRKMADNPRLSSSPLKS